MPILRDEQLQFVLCIYDSEARDWREDEIELMRELVNRIWTRLERARAEEALRESEDQLRAIYDGTREYIGLLAPDGTLLRANRASLGFGESSPDDVLGRPFWETVWFANTPGMPEAVRRGVELVAAGEFFREELDLVRPTGEVRSFDFSLRPIKDARGEVVAIVPEGRDITERRELQEERERLRARELTARAEAAERERISRELHDRVAHSLGVAHQALELYTALAESAPSRAAEKLELARGTTRRTLDQTRALAAELKRLQEGDLEEGMEAALRAVAETSVPDGVAVEISVTGDEARLPRPAAVQAYLIMREAMRNAVRHSGCSRIATRMEVGEAEVVGSVEDDGQGFDPEAVAKASPSWGVGLRSMRERAEMLGGELRLALKPGEGTRVELRVPLEVRP